MKKLALKSIPLLAAIAFGTWYFWPSAPQSTSPLGEIAVKVGEMAKVEVKYAGVGKWLNPPANADKVQIQMYSDHCLVVCRSPGAYDLGFVAASRGRIQETWGKLVATGHQPPIPPPPPPPPPPPIPPDPPKPPPPPISKKVTGLVVIEETAEATAARGAFFADADLWKHITQNKIVWRIADKDQRDVNGKLPKDIEPYMERAKTMKLPALWLFAGTECVADGIPMPKTPKLLLEVLK